MRVATCLIISLALYSTDLLADTAACPRELERAAEAAIPKAADWPALHQAFLRYRNCDDGAIAESFSDRVTVLLVTQWDDLSQLGQLLSADNSFADFVMRHIDETTDPKHLERISMSARTRGCAGLTDTTCTNIRTKAEAAERRLRAMPK